MRRSIYTYTSYREFLRDTYHYLKEREGLTLRDFAVRAGFNTHTFLTYVIEKKRSLTVDSAAKVSRGFGLSPEERTYLELMVRFENAKTIDDKNDIYEQMCVLLPKSEIRTLGAEYYEVFRNAYVLAIRELVTFSDFRTDPKWISRKLQPQITPKQAEKAVNVLVNSGLLKQAGTKLEQAHADLTTGAEVKSMAISLYHKQLLQLAARALDDTPSRKRDISSLTLNISQSDFDFIKRRTAAFRSEILDFLKKKRGAAVHEFPEEEEKKRALYYLNMQFFNATEIPWQ